MKFEDLVAAMDPKIHARMKQAIELGKWPDGRRLNAEELEACMQAVIAYDARHVAEEKRVGYIDRRKADGKAHGPNRSTDDIIRVIRDQH